MNLSDLAKYLPTIVTALANPVVGVAQLAAQFLAPKIGTDGTVTQAIQKLSGMSSDDIIKLKDLDVQLAIHLSDNGLKLAQLEQALDVGEQDINKIEASSNSLFISGWRPALGWVGSFGIGYQFLVRPLFNGVVFMFGGSYIFPSLEMQDLIALVTLLLGHSAMRSWDKKNGG